MSDKDIGFTRGTRFEIQQCNFWFKFFTSTSTQAQNFFFKFCKTGLYLYYKNSVLLMVYNKVVILAFFNAKIIILDKKKSCFLSDSQANSLRRLLN